MVFVLLLVVFVLFANSYRYFLYFWLTLFPYLLLVYILLMLGFSLFQSLQVNILTVYLDFDLLDFEFVCFVATFQMYLRNNHLLLRYFSYLYNNLRFLYL